MSAFVVRSEKDAWHLLEFWMAGNDLPEVEFEGWPVLRIDIKGDEYHSSLNSSQMSALVNFKMTIGRTYAAMTHGAYDMRRLKAEEEEQLDFNTTVEKGSSILDTDLTPLVQALASAVQTNPTLSVVSGLLIALTFVARPIILKHYETRAKQLDTEERGRLIDLSLNSKEQLQHALFEKALAKLSNQRPQISQALPDASNAFWKFASASANADSLEVAGIIFGQDDLEILSERRKDRPSKVKEIRKTFSVLGIKKVQSFYKVELISKELTVQAVYRKPHLTDARIKRLFRCVTTSETITATLEIKTVDKAQVAARLTTFSVNALDAVA